MNKIIESVAAGIGIVLGIILFMVDLFIGCICIATYIAHGVIDAAIIEMLPRVAMCNMVAIPIIVTMYFIAEKQKPTT